MSQLLAMMYDLKRFVMKDLSTTSLVVKTGSNEAAMKEICQYLEKEAYPLIEYKVTVSDLVSGRPCRIMSLACVCRTCRSG